MHKLFLEEYITKWGVQMCSKGTELMVKISKIYLLMYHFSLKPWNQW